MDTLMMEATTMKCAAEMTLSSVTCGVSAIEWAAIGLAARDVLNIPAVRLGLAVAVLLVLIAVAFWLLARFRDYADDNRHDPSELLRNIEEMHLRGDISEAEYRNIKSTTERHVVNGLRNSEAPLSDSSEPKPTDRSPTRSTDD